MGGVEVYFCGSGCKLSVLCKKSPNLPLRMISDFLVTGLIPPILRRSPLHPVWRKVIYDTVSLPGERCALSSSLFQLLMDGKIVYQDRKGGLTAKKGATLVGVPG